MSLQSTNNKKNQKISEKKDVIIPKEIRSEVNLLVLPFFALWDKDIKRRNETECRMVIKRGKERLEVVWTVSSNTKYGYPGPFDRSVHKAVEQIIGELPTPIQNPVPLGSLYGICKRMGINKLGGAQYRKIKGALERITTTSIKSEGAFYSKEREEWIEDIFHLYDRVIFKGKKLPNGEFADTNYLYLNSWYLDNVNANYVKPIDWNYYLSLETPINQRLYELLSVKFYGLLMKSGKFISYKYSSLCNLLPITRQKYYSKAKKILDPAHDKLKKTMFLDKWVWVEIPNIEGENDWIIKYYPGSRAKEEIRRSRTGEQLEFGLTSFGSERVIDEVSDSSYKTCEIIEKLIQRGITKFAASNLTKSYSSDQIKKQLEIFDWLIERKSSLLAKNSAGFLRKSIEEDYQPPEEYVREQKRIIIKQEEEQNKIEEESENIKQNDIQSQVDEYREKLDDQDKDTLRNEAIALIENDDSIKKIFVNNILIRAKESEIIRKRLNLE